MRISVVPGDPGEVTYAALVRRDKKIVRVFFNGEEIAQGCVTADDREGFVIVHPVDEKGRFIHDGADWTTERRCGKVRIEVHECPRA